MSWASASPFGSGMLPVSPAMSTFQDLELSMSFDSTPGSLPQELGQLLSQSNPFAVGREGSFGSGGGFTGPASIERQSQLEQNFTSNFSCCGLQLKGLHDLLEQCV